LDVEKGSLEVLDQYKDFDYQIYEAIFGHEDEIIGITISKNRV